MRSLANSVKTCRYFHNLKQSNLYICLVINYLQMHLKSLASYLQFFLQKQLFNHLTSTFSIIAMKRLFWAALSSVS
jgi:hypothetical protein